MDTGGLLLAVVITAAHVQDRDGAGRCCGTCTAPAASTPTYGHGEERILPTAYDRQVDAFIAVGGSGYVALVLDLGVICGRINTVADFAAARESGARTTGTRRHGRLRRTRRLGASSNMNQHDPPWRRAKSHGSLGVPPLPNHKALTKPESTV